MGVRETVREARLRWLNAREEKRLETPIVSDELDGSKSSSKPKHNTNGTEDNPINLDEDDSPPSNENNKKPSTKPIVLLDLDSDLDSDHQQRPTKKVKTSPPSRSSPIEAFYTPIAPQKDSVGFDTLFPNSVYKTYQFLMQIDLDLLVPAIMRRTSVAPEIFIASQDLFHQEQYKDLPIHRIDLQILGWRLHHSKFMVNFHQKGTLEKPEKYVQIVVMTCNLTPVEFAYTGSLFWRSPLLPLGDGPPVGFGADLDQYLRLYSDERIKSLSDELAKYDFSGVRASFIGSSPVKAPNQGFKKLESILSQYKLNRPSDKKKVVLASCSSLGAAYKALPVANMITHVLAPLAAGLKAPLAPGTESYKTAQKNGKFKPIIVFPTNRELAEAEGQGVAQTFIFHDPKPGSENYKLTQNLFYKRDIDKEIRSTRKYVVNHSKVYLASDDYTSSSLGVDIHCLSWVMVGSFNLSKSAWGLPTKIGCTGNNWECGVVLSPAHYEEDVIFKPVWNTNRVQTVGTLDNEVPIRLPFPFPILKSEADEVFTKQR